MRTRLIAITLAAAAGATLLAGVPAVEASTTSYCGIAWGSLPKSVMQSTNSPIVNARVGQQECSIGW